jgi:hydroxymethylpyrimidine/phosphomethylpyrimidine kinase
MLRDAQRFEVSARLRSAAVKAAGMLHGDGVRMAFALPGAESLEDVCGLEMMDGAPGCESFGAAGELGAAVLSALRLDGRERAGLELRFTGERARATRDAELVTRVIRDGHRSSPVPGIGTEDALIHLGFVPDAVIDRGGRGREPIIRLFAPSPEELLGKLGLVLR